MKILFIGGTQFVGRQMVEDAVKQGHEICLLQRGKTNVNLFRDVKKYMGDRFDIANILPSKQSYDVVIDTCAYHPEVLEKSCLYLKDKTQKYVFISTCSVYKDFSVVGLNENSQTSSIDPIPDRLSPITSENYGPLKALCEKVVLENFSSTRSLIVRPCIVVGAYDHTKRFDYWISSIMKNNVLNVPNDETSYIQFVDNRALSDFCLKDKTGIYNTVGPKNKILFIDFIKKARSILNPNLEIKFVDPKSEKFPMYVSDPQYKGFFSFDGSKAYQNGFLDISIEDTINTVAKYITQT